MKPAARALLSIGVTVCAGLGIWSSYRMIRADALFRKDTAESVEAAIRLVPDEPRYYMRLALLDDSRASQSLETALRVAPYNAPAAIELALRSESRGDYARAEQLLLGAFAVDRTYLVRWTLANYYLRRDNLPSFWLWARRAAELPSSDIGPLLGLCWRVEPDARAIAGHFLTGDPAVIAQFLTFVLAKDQVPALPDPASRLIAHGEANRDLALVLAAVDRLIAANDGASASSLWRILKARGWIADDDTLPYNGRFAREPVRGGFDWKLPPVDGLHSSTGAGGLEVELSGKEPESCVIAEQVMVLKPGRYDLHWRYHTELAASSTGLQWQVEDTRSGATLGTSADLVNGSDQEQETAFTVPVPSALVRLRLHYRRAAGTTRIAGMVTLRSVWLENKAAAAQRPD